MAVAARAGYSTCEPNIDRDSVDLTIQAGGGKRPKLDIQLKATSGLAWKSQSASFSLKRKNYDDLRQPRMVPIILMVLDLPECEDKWMHCDASSLILSRCALWLSLTDAPPIETESRTVQLHEHQRFNPDSLREMMQKSRGSQPL